MGSLDNRFRRKWQDYSGLSAARAEHSFYDVFNRIFEGTEYEITFHPTDFRDLYVNVPLSPEELSEIYVPDEPLGRHGFTPDFSIRNTLTGKTIYVELKRQDGWVEGKDKKAGRGNAHERLCKYFTPGLLRTLREKGGWTDDSYYPFCIVFQGDITRDPKRVREITFWFQEYKANYFFWRNVADPLPLIAHFERYILPLLD